MIRTMFWFIVWLLEIKEYNMGRLFNIDELEDRVNDRRKRLVEDKNMISWSTGYVVPEIYELEDKIVELLAENEALKSKNKDLKLELKRDRENAIRRFIVGRARILMW